MKKIVFISALLLISVGSFAQYNPVKELNWSHWYECPYNFYNLNWSVPDSTEVDTLVGYNVYRNNVLWRFQPAPGVSCVPYLCNDPGFILIEPFWIKVTAVYNAAHTESAATDSIQDLGLLIGISEKSNNQPRLLNNPVNHGEILRVTLSQAIPQGELLLYDNLGVVVAKQSLRGDETMVQVNTAGLPSGIYFLTVKSDAFKSVQKVIIR